MHDRDDINEHYPHKWAELNQEDAYEIYQQEEENERIAIDTYEQEH